MTGRSLLLDTHALLRRGLKSRALSTKVKRLVANESTRVFVSVPSAWEIATKVRLGKLTWNSPDSVQAYCMGQGFELIDVTFTHGERAGSWPQPHGDPFDRVLAAQSEIEAIPLATNDPKLVLVGIDIIG